MNIEIQAAKSRMWNCLNEAYNLVGHNELEIKNTARRLYKKQFDFYPFIELEMTIDKYLKG